MQLPLTHTYWSATQTCALTGNPLVHRPAINPLSHTSQGTKNFINLYILSTSVISCMVYSVNCSQLTSQFDCYRLQLVCLTAEHHLMRNLQYETSQTIFDMFDQSQHLSIHCTNLFLFLLRFNLS